jgi:hypothetical protein
MCQRKLSAQVLHMDWYLVALEGQCEPECSLSQTFVFLGKPFLFEWFVTIERNEMKMAPNLCINQLNWSILSEFAVPDEGNVFFIY